MTSQISPCSCGLPSASQCRLMFDEILAKEYTDFQYAKQHRLTVDTYCLQHPDEYLGSAKSFAAHLTGICCAMQYDNDPNLLQLLQQWLNGQKKLEKPPMLETFGPLTIAYVAQANNGIEHGNRVYAWAVSVWQAYQPYHKLAEVWINQARGLS